jgi:hypothetical protein
MPKNLFVFRMSEPYRGNGGVLARFPDTSTAEKSGAQEENPTSSLATLAQDRTSFRCSRRLPRPGWRGIRLRITRAFAATTVGFRAH